ncbi:hypothetical protein EDD21DRAFT_118252 [Dissophora ornata]|nr:hypothetical protein EDD21DRAFT_118252 [Dissophora ornata]
MATWDQIRSEVRSFRASVQPTVTTIRDFTFDSSRDRIYFLANDLSRSSKSPMLFHVDLPRPYPASSPSSCCSNADTDTDTDADTGEYEDVDPMVTPQCNADGRYRHRTGHHRTNQQHESHGGNQDQHLDQDDHDMDLVPFNPDSYQYFAAPIPPIQITPGPREPRHGAPSPSCASDRYPHHSYSATSSTSATDQILAAAPVLSWTPVLTEEWLKYSNTNLGHSQSDRLSFYQFEPQVNRLMFPYGAVIYTSDVQESIHSLLEETLLLQNQPLIAHIPTLFTML